jgi:hypothetical protein
MYSHVHARICTDFATKTSDRNVLPWMTSVFIARVPLPHLERVSWHEQNEGYLKRESGDIDLNFLRMQQRSLQRSVPYSE